MMEIRNFGTGMIVDAMHASRLVILIKLVIISVHLVSSSHVIHTISVLAVDEESEQR